MSVPVLAARADPSVLRAGSWESRTVVRLVLFRTVRRLPCCKDGSGTGPEMPHFHPFWPSLVTKLLIFAPIASFVSTTGTCSLSCSYNPPALCHSPLYD